MGRRRHLRAQPRRADGGVDGGVDLRPRLRRGAPGAVLQGARRPASSRRASPSASASTPPGTCRSRSSGSCSRARASCSATCRATTCPAGRSRARTRSTCRRRRSTRPRARSARRSCPVWAVEGPFEIRLEIERDGAVAFEGDDLHRVADPLRRGPRRLAVRGACRSRPARCCSPARGSCRRSRSPWLAGDVVRVLVDGVGMLENPVRAVGTDPRAAAQEDGR